MPWEKQFDRADALERALRVFWRTGYEKSSLMVLLKGMGVQKRSFYATFGSKHRVLVEALQLCIKHRFDSFLDLRVNRRPLATLRRHLDDVVRESTDPDRFMGCFLVKRPQSDRTSVRDDVRPNDERAACHDRQVPPRRR